MGAAGRLHVPIARLWQCPRVQQARIQYFYFFTASSQDYYPLVKKEPALAALEGNLAGSRPKELFEDALEAADAQFDKDRAALKKAVKEAELAVEADTTFEAFVAALEAAEGIKGIIKPNRWGGGSLVPLGRVLSACQSLPCSCSCAGMALVLLPLGTKLGSNPHQCTGALGLQSELHRPAESFPAEPHATPVTVSRGHAWTLLPWGPAQEAVVRRAAGAGQERLGLSVRNPMGTPGILFPWAMHGRCPLPWRRKLVYDELLERARERPSPARTL